MSQSADALPRHLRVAGTADTGSPLAPGLLWLDLEADDFRNANACLRGWSTSLRAADALHLAIAAGRGATLCSLDAPFVQAAQQLGLAALLINPARAICGD